MTLPSACTVCGKNFKRREFDTDWLGRVYLVHRCDPEQIRRYQEREREIVEDAAPHVYTLTIDCERCGVETPVKSSSQRYCVGCATTVRRERGLSYYRERKRA